MDYGETVSNIEEVKNINSKIKNYEDLKKFWAKEAKKRNS